MKLMTKELEKKLAKYPLGSQEGLMEDAEVIVNLIFIPLNYAHERYKDMPIELKLAEVSKRGDRKAYGNGENGRSQIKNFFINDLHLSTDKNSEDYFAIYKTNFGEYYLYFIPKPLYENFRVT